jgi:hypothetical protein
LAAEELRDGAAYLAALLILTGRSAICTAHQRDAALKSDLHLDSVLADPNFRKIGNRNAVVASLNSALFSSRGENRLGFTHQTFAECLAARQVCHMPLPQLRKLFCGKDSINEHVIPQLAETAAWLAGINDEFLQHILKIDPEVLLRSDIARIQGNTKKEVIHAILEKAKRSELFDEIGLRRFLSGLKHDELAEQLWTYIQDDTANVIARRLTLEIAEDCELRELNDRLLTVLFNSALEQQVREGAARVLKKTLPNDRLSELVPLARGQCDPDPDDQIKSYALERLVPAYWSVTDALQCMTPPRNDHFHGAYHMFLHYEAPKRIVVDDLPALLNWLLDIEHCFDILSPFCGLASRALPLAIANLKEPKIREATIRFWREKKRKYEHLSGGRRDDELETLWTNDSVRRDFAFAVFEEPETTEDDVSHLLFDTFPLFEGRDLEWVLERLPDVTANRLPVWAKVVWWLARPENTVCCWDLFLQRIQQIPELQSCFAWLRAWDLDDPESRKAKARYLWDERRRLRWAQRRKTPDPNDLISRDLELIAQGEHWCWKSLCDNLSLKAGDSHYHAHLRHDITEEPGWKASDEKRRALIRKAAKQFLLHHSDGYEELNARTNFSDPGYLAIWLLRDEVKDDQALKDAISKKWICSVIGYFNNAEDHYQQMVSLVYSLNPDGTVEALRREAEDSFERHGYVFAWRGFARSWDPRLSAVLAEFVVSHSTKREALVSSLCFLYEHDKPAFDAWVRKILPRVQRFGEQARCTILAIGHALAPSENWNYIWPIITNDHDLAKKVLLTVASELAFETRKKPLDLRADELANLTELLHDIFPPDPDSERMGGVVTPRQAVADYRRKISDALTACTDPQAGTALLGLAKRFPDREVEFMYRYRDHLRTRRLTLWEPPSPEQLSEMIARSEARLVFSDRDLFEVVLESIRRFEEYYTKQELPAVERLWQRSTGPNRRTRDGKKKKPKRWTRKSTWLKPKDEENLSDELARWLRDDLKAKGVVIGREVQIERKHKTDVLVKAVSLVSGEKIEDPFTVVVEVKGCWNPNVREDAESQLVQKYLLPHNWTFGIYLVGWFICEAWPSPRNHLNSADFEEAFAEVEKIGVAVSSAHPQVTVSGLLLDCRHS